MLFLIKCIHLTNSHLGWICATKPLEIGQNNLKYIEEETITDIGKIRNDIVEYIKHIELVRHDLEETEMSLKNSNIYVLQD